MDEQGPLTFAEFMQLALYHPRFGYYRGGREKFGVGGDFVTAPELSPLFSRCIARYYAETAFDTLLEIGAGSGVLAYECLLELEKIQRLPQTYFILEISAELAQRQQALIKSKLPHLFERFCWLQSWPEKNFAGLVIANEVLDAMPVHRFCIEQGVKEYYVTHDQGIFRWHLGEVSDPGIQNQLNNYGISFSEGYTSEINLLIKPWIQSLSEHLEESARVLLIDYGYKREEYYHPQRSMGTLMSYYQHQAYEDVLAYPGRQDITAHVDFTLVAEAAELAGMKIMNFETQAQFLMRRGIMDLWAEEGDPVQKSKYAQQIKQLLLPGRMGEAFKVIELFKA